jgi:hypothetical protein
VQDKGKIKEVINNLGKRKSPVLLPPIKDLSAPSFLSNYRDYFAKDRGHRF